MAIEVHFENIRDEILKVLEAAERSILVAMAWLTDPKIYECLCSKKSEAHLQVEILLMDNDENRAFNYDELVKLGASISFVKYQCNSGTMHHKFCVVDDITVITGSYNWSNHAQCNYENILIAEYELEIVEKYKTQFEYIKKHHEKNHNQALEVRVIVAQLQEAVPVPYVSRADWVEALKTACNDRAEQELAALEAARATRIARRAALMKTPPDANNERNTGA